MSESMSVSKALKQLKLLSKRIIDVLDDDFGDRYSPIANFVTVQQGKKNVGKNTTVEEFKEQAKANWDKVMDLIERRKKIKSKVALSNATTYVTVNGKQMTVAEAIEYKNSIDFEKRLLNILRGELNVADDALNNNNIAIEKRLEAHLKNLFGEGKDRTATDMEIEAATKGFLERFEWKIVEGIDVKKKIENLQKTIEEFESDVDDIINTSNVETKIVLE